MEQLHIAAAHIPNAGPPPCQLRVVQPIQPGQRFLRGGARKARLRRAAVFLQLPPRAEHRHKAAFAGHGVVPAPLERIEPVCRALDHHHRIRRVRHGVQQARQRCLLVARPECVFRKMQVLERLRTADPRAARRHHLDGAAQPRAARPAGAAGRIKHQLPRVTCPALRLQRRRQIVVKPLRHIEQIVRAVVPVRHNAAAHGPARCRPLEDQRLGKRGKAHLPRLQHNGAQGLARPRLRRQRTIQLVLRRVQAQRHDLGIFCADAQILLQILFGVHRHVSFCSPPLAWARL